MSTKTQTNQSQSYTNTSAINYDPTALAQYQKNISTLFPTLQNYLQNPFNNPFFNMQRSMLNNQAVGLGQRGINAVTSNAQQAGMGTNSGFLQSMIGRQNRATSALQAGGLFSAMQSGLANQWNAAGIMSSFQPLMTGSTSSGNSNMQSTTTTSGLGTWLPQLAGSAIGAAGNVFSGGLSGLAKTAAGAASSAAGLGAQYGSNVPYSLGNFGVVGPYGVGGYSNPFSTGNLGAFYGGGSTGMFGGGSPSSFGSAPFMWGLPH